MAVEGALAEVQDLEVADAGWGGLEACESSVVALNREGGNAEEGVAIGRAEGSESAGKVEIKLGERQREGR